MIYTAFYIPVFTESMKYTLSFLQCRGFFWTMNRAKVNFQTCYFPFNFISKLFYSVAKTSKDETRYTCDLNERNFSIMWFYWCSSQSHNIKYKLKVIGSRSKFFNGFWLQAPPSLYAPPFYERNARVLLMY